MYKNDSESKSFEIKINGSEDAELANSAAREKIEIPINDYQEVPREKITGDLNSISTNEQLKRLQAEFSNYKKRMDNEKYMLSDVVRSDFMTNLLPILDDFDRMMNHFSEDEVELRVGIEMIFKKLKNTLHEQGLETVKTVGRKFDPKYHEALMTDNKEDAEDEEVTDEWRKGYLYKTRLLRAAQVKVNKLSD